MSNPVRDSAANISEAFSQWLRDEVASSSSEGDVNVYLDEFNTAREGLRGGWDHPKNFTARKLESHLTRLPLWWEAYTLDPSDDYQSARFLFNSLMQVSGCYRNQCYMEAKDADDYKERRLKAVGIYLGTTVLHRLMDTVPASGSFAEADITLEELDKVRVEVSEAGEEAVRKVCKRTVAGFDFGVPDSMSAKFMMEAQHAWLNLSSDSVVFAAKIRGGELAAVPFLEAKSISEEPQVIYPIAA